MHAEQPRCFDVVEQLVGYRIDPYQESQAVCASDIVAI